VRADQLVELGLMVANEPSEGARERVGISWKRLLEGPTEQIALIQRPDRSAALLSPTHATSVVATSADDRELFGDRGEDLASVVRDHDQVLDPHAEAPGDVNAGLDRHDVTRREHRFRRLR
jgi:hypothetical protein